MPRSLYITALGPSSGKSAMALGIMEMLSRRVGRVGFFRPVIRAGSQPDNDIELMRSRYRLPFAHDELFAFTSDDIREIAAAGPDAEAAALERIVQRFRDIESRCDAVLCEGTDYTGLSSPLEFDFNARVATHLGCPVVAVVDGRGKGAAEVLGAVRLAEGSLASHGIAVIAAIANRVPATQVEQVRRELRAEPNDMGPVYVVPEDPRLSSPTVGELAAALDAVLLYGGPGDLDREVRRVKVAAMTLPNVLDHLQDGTLYITAGDRADVLVGSVLSRQSIGYPKAAGVVLTGGLRPEPSVARLLDGLVSAPLPVLAVETDTFDTATAIHAVRASITPGNERKISAALGLFETNVDVAALEQRIQVVRSDRVTPLMFQYDLIERARADRRHIVLPEASDDRILRAADQLLRRRVVNLTLLGAERAVRERAGTLGLDLAEAEVVDPTESPWLDEFATTYYSLRRHKGVTEQLAHDLLTDASYFGTMMVYAGKADAMVSGAIHTTAHTIRPALEFIKTRPGVSIVSSVFFMALPEQVLVYGDCAVNPNPTATQLADIAISSADTAALFGIEPRVAMLSYSTGDSGSGEDVDKVREATALARQRRPDLAIEGPLQYDAAVDPDVAATKLPGSTVAGRATVFVFPDLNTGNNTYKAVQRSAGAVAIGPVLQGLRKPINDLSRGATVVDIVNTVVITAIQAQEVAG